MNARETILADVRAALRSARIPNEPLPPPLLVPLESAAPLIWRERFMAELRLLGVVVFDESSEAAVADRVLESIGARRLLAWPDAALPPAVAHAVATLPLGQRLDLAAPRSTLATAEVGLTGVDAAVAETGSLLLVASRDHPRTPSLLPPLHVAVVRGSEIAPTFRVALERWRGAIPTASALHLITGPSRTADIELQLTLGVHGPGALIVVLGP